MSDPDRELLEREDDAEERRMYRRRALEIGVPSEGKKRNEDGSKKSKRWGGYGEDKAKVFALVEASMGSGYCIDDLPRKPSITPRDGGC